MKYLLALASIIVVIILPLACGGTSTDTGSKPTNASWHHVVTFSGTGSKTTSSCYIPGDKFRLTWTIDVEADASQYGIGGSFGVFVYPQYETAWYVDYFDAGNVMYFDTNTNYVYEGKGNYYLKVIAANLDSWEIEVESYHVSAATPPDTTPTPSDTTPPVISAVSASITTTTATITWTTNEPATTRVEYGLTTSCGSTTTLDTNLVTSHNVSLIGLAASTTYHYRVKSKDAAQNEAVSGDFTFRTAAPTTTPMISLVSTSGITASTATITWTTDEVATGQVEYGQTTSYGLDTTLDPTLVTNHSVNISGLAASTTYHYRVKSKDAVGNKAVSSDYTFTTLSIPVLLQQFLESNFATCQTELGPTTFTFTIYHNDSILFPYDYHIMVEYDMSFFYDLQYSNQITTEVNHTVCQELKDHQEQLARAVIQFMPDKKFEGGYYHSWYTYPEIHYDLNVRRYYSWVNYEPASILTNYDDAKVSGFSWYPDLDDNLMR
jgi:hypothetical protein